MAPKRKRSEGAEEEEEDARGRMSTIKCGLASILRAEVRAGAGEEVTRQQVLTAMDLLVAALTRLRFEALSLLGLVAVRMFEDAQQAAAPAPAHCARCRELREARGAAWAELTGNDTYAALSTVAEYDLSARGKKLGRPSTRAENAEDELVRHVYQEHFLPLRNNAAAGARVHVSGLTAFLPPLARAATAARGGGLRAS